MREDQHGTHRRTTPGTWPPAWARRRRWSPRPGRVATRADDAADRRSVRRAAGARGRASTSSPGWPPASSTPADLDGGDGAGRHAAVRRQHGRADPVLRRLLRSTRPRPGVRQAVILASGLDSRGLPAAVARRHVVFEIDQPEVIEFKTGDAGRARRRARPPICARSPSTCATTGRPRWPRPASTPTKPTAWIAEGLLGYLPPEAQDRLLDHDHRAERAGQPARRRGRAAHQDGDEDEVRERMQAVDRPVARATASTSTSPSWCYSATAPRSTAYLQGTAGTIDASRTNELFAGTAWRRSTTERRRFADVVYVTATHEVGDAWHASGRATAGIWLPASARRRRWSPPPGAGHRGTRSR